MLRAIQLMGWPLDMICSVDIWFDENTPAELPPMVAFKDDYDAKVLERFGVPVTRLCATKRERERERDCRTAACSSLPSTPINTDGTSKVFQTQTTHGANSLKTSLTGDIPSRQKLTYCDIFYRTITTRRERERESGYTAIRLSEDNGATVSSREKQYRIPKFVVSVVQRRTQKSGVYGFPIQTVRGNWCTKLKRSPLHDAPERGAENKYRSLHRHSGRRTAPHQEAHRQARQGATACANRMG